MPSIDPIAADFAENCEHNFVMMNGSLLTREMEGLGDFVVDGSFLVLNDRAYSSLSQNSSPSTQQSVSTAVENVEMLETELNGLDPEEVREIMSTPVTPPSAVPVAMPRSNIGPHVHDIQSLTPSFISSTVNGSINHSSIITASGCSSTASTESTLEEVTVQLAQLQAENVNLKDSFSEVNTTMKNNLSMFQEWQKQVSTVHDSQKEKYDESRRAISSLREHNDKLKTKVSILESQLQENLSTPGSSESDFVKLEGLEAQLMAKEEALNRMKLLMEDCSNLLVSERLQNDSLKELLRNMENQNSANVLGLGVENLTLEVKEKEEYETKLNILRQEKKEYETKLNFLRQEKEEHEAKLNVLMQEKEEYGAKLNVLRQEKEAARDTISKFNEHRMKKESEIVLLKERIEAAEVTIGYLKTSLASKEDELASLKDALDKTHITLEDYRKKLQEKERDNIVLNTRIAAIKAEHDDFEHMKAQLDVYRADFEAEREARSKIADERETLSQELTEVREELRAKSIELESLHKTHLALATEHAFRPDSTPSSPSEYSSLPSMAGHVFGFIKRGVLGFRDDSASQMESSENNVAEASSSVPPASKEKEIQPCPLCRKKFDNVQNLQKHAATCGVENMEFTDPFVFP